MTHPWGESKGNKHAILTKEHRLRTPCLGLEEPTPFAVHSDLRRTLRLVQWISLSFYFYLWVCGVQLYLGATHGESTPIIFQFLQARNLSSKTINRQPTTRQQLYLSAWCNWKKRFTNLRTRIANLSWRNSNFCGSLKGTGLNFCMSLKGTGLYFCMCWREKQNSWSNPSMRNANLQNA